MIEVHVKSHDTTRLRLIVSQTTGNGGTSLIYKLLTNSYGKASAEAVEIPAIDYEILVSRLSIAITQELHKWVEENE